METVHAQNSLSSSSSSSSLMTNDNANNGHSQKTAAHNMTSATGTNGIPPRSEDQVHMTRQRSRASMGAAEEANLPAGGGSTKKRTGRTLQGNSRKNSDAIIDDESEDDDLSPLPSRPSAMIGHAGGHDKSVTQASPPKNKTQSAAVSPTLSASKGSFHKKLSPSPSGVVEDEQEADDDDDDNKAEDSELSDVEIERAVLEEEEDDGEEDDGSIAMESSKRRPQKRSRGKSRTTKHDTDDDDEDEDEEEEEIVEDQDDLDENASSSVSITEEDEENDDDEEGEDAEDDIAERKSPKERRRSKSRTARKRVKGHNAERGDGEPSTAKKARRNKPEPKPAAARAAMGRKAKEAALVSNAADRPRRQIRKPKRMEDEEEDQQSLLDEAVEEETEDRQATEKFTPVIIDKETIAKEMTLLENRAQAVRFKEWELECAQIQFTVQSERFKAAEASRAVSDAQHALEKLQTDVLRAGKLVGDVADVPRETATRYAEATEFLETFLSSLSKLVDTRLAARTPTLPPPPKRTESVLMSLKDRPAAVPRKRIEGAEDEDEFVSQLLELSREARKELSPPSKQGKSSTDRAAAKSARVASSAASAAAGAVSAAAEAAASQVARTVGGESLGMADFRPLPITVTPLKATASSLGLHSDEPLYQLRFTFPCEYISAKVRQRYQHAVVANQLKSLRLNFGDGNKAIDFPKRIDTDVVCLPPLSNLAGRLPSCGLCGFTVKREDYRGRATKNGTNLPCLVHTYHAYCLAYVQTVCKRVCIAPLMGVASPCNLNERARTGQH